MLSRRDFLATSLATGVTALARAETAEPPAAVLRLERRTIEVNGKAASVFGIRQPDGTAGIATEVGRPFRVRVENHIDEPSLIHWHGLAPPWQQDGVSGISAPPIPPGGGADYDFPLDFGGTFWMHSHQGLQEQLLMAAPLIIHDDRDRGDQQEIIMMLADFSFTAPEQIFETLRTGQKMAGMASAPSGGHHMPGMTMPMSATPGDNKPDLNDVKYDAFLANDRTLADPQVVKIEPAGRALLRVINASSMSAYHIDLGELEGELIAVDGFRTIPVRGRIFPISVAQRLDIQLTIPQADAAYPVLAQLEGERRRTGIILIAGRGQIARIPEMATTASAPLTLTLERRLLAAESLTPRRADRIHKVNLTGDMSAYQWSINNVAWTKDVPPLPVAKGERVELVITNETSMPHPMHLHGHKFQVVSIAGRRFAGALRDTVLVPPQTSVTVAFDANNPGWWAFHCHLLYHMEAGMFATLRYV